MTSQELKNLVAIRQLKEEPHDQGEFDGLVQSGRSRLTDARLDGLSIESRFDLSYNAAHSLALAALRRKGYRSDNRYSVFVCLPHTLGVGPEVWRVLLQGHNARNRGEYEGYFDISERLVDDLIHAAEVVLSEVDKL